jgi:hypothetical protein
MGFLLSAHELIEGQPGICIVPARRITSDVVAVRRETRMVVFGSEAFGVGIIFAAESPPRAAIFSTGWTLCTSAPCRLFEFHP